MAVTAGQIIQAGDLGRAIREWLRGGRGAAGWSAARNFLERQHPTASANSITAVIGHAQDVVQIGARYARAGPGYAVPAASVPDLRYLQPRPPTPPGEPPGPLRESGFHHEAIVQVRDLSAGGQIVQTFRFSFKADAPATEGDWSNMIAQASNQFIGTFVNYDPTRLGQRQLSTDFYFGGIYRAF